MAALLRQGARRVGGSVLQRAQAAVASPAAAEGRRRLLVPRRMYSTEETEDPLTVDSHVIKALMESKSLLTQKELEMISLAELKRLDEIGLMLRGEVSAPPAEAKKKVSAPPPAEAKKKVSAPPHAEAKKRWEISTPANAYMVVFVLKLSVLLFLLR